MSTQLSVALIGLDSSHSVEFSRSMNDPDCPEKRKVSGLRSKSCLRFPSAFQAEEGQDERQAQLEAWGVEVTRDLDTAVAGCDVIMLEANDPVDHLPWFEKVAGLGKPIYVDKPLADSAANGRRIKEIAEASGISVWTASSLRFVRELAEAREAVTGPLAANVYGPLGKASAGSDVIWYGIHTAEMLVAALGTGIAAVQAVKDGQGVVAVATYHDGRRGVMECNTGIWSYGGRLASAESVTDYRVDTSVGLYTNLLLQARDFFHGGDVPVPIDESIEIMALLEAIERSIASGNEEPLN